MVDIDFKELLQFWVYRGSIYVVMVYIMVLGTWNYSCRASASFHAYEVVPPPSP